jgi:hypothetical protein
VEEIAEKSSLPGMLYKTQDNAIIRHFRSLTTPVPQTAATVRRLRFCSGMPALLGHDRLIRCFKKEILERLPYLFPIACLGTKERRRLLSSPYRLPPVGIGGF